MILLDAVNPGRFFYRGKSERWWWTTY